MNQRGPFSVAAIGNLIKWVPQDLAKAAWHKAYSTHLARASTVDGTAKQYATERADRFWPNYLPEPPR